MEPIHVILNATSDELPGASECISDGRITAVGGIPNGTEAGLAAVAIVVTTSEGHTVIGQTTLALLSNAVRALVARYPDPRP